VVKRQMAVEVCLAWDCFVAALLAMTWTP